MKNNVNKELKIGRGVGVKRKILKNNKKEHKFVTINSM
jgi:hypothetical protein